MSGSNVYESIVLDSNAMGESDLVVTLFTLEHGKVRCVAKGARKSKRRFMNALEPSTFLHAVIRESSRSTLFFLENATVKNVFESLRTDYTSFVMASLAMELVDLWCRQNQQEKQIYDLLLWYLTSLDGTGVPRQKMVLTLVFKTRLLDACGHFPPLGICARCKKEIYSRQAAYQPATGQLLCGGCKKEVNRHFLDLGAIRTMEYWQSRPAKRLMRLQVSRFVMNQIWHYLKDVHSHLLERQPKAYALAETVVSKCMGNQ